MDPDKKGTPHFFRFETIEIAYCQIKKTVELNGNRIAKDPSGNSWRDFGGKAATPSKFIRLHRTPSLFILFFIWRAFFLQGLVLFSVLDGSKINKNHYDSHIYIYIYIYIYIVMQAIRHFADSWSNNLTFVDLSFAFFIDLSVLSCLLFFQRFLFFLFFFLFSCGISYNICGFTCRISC